VRQAGQKKIRGDVTFPKKRGRCHILNFASLVASINLSRYFELLAAVPAPTLPPPPFPIVHSTVIEFDLDSQGNRKELGRGVFKAVYRGRVFGTPVAVRIFSLK
jgi:hypothetical protein